MSIAEAPPERPSDSLPLQVTAWVAIVAGVLAIASPFVAGLAATLLLAAYFTVGGVFELLAAFRAGGLAKSLWLAVLGAVSIAAGIYIFAHPVIGLGAITLVAIAGMFVEGIFKLLWAFQVPNERGRWWLVLSAALTILLAAMLFSNFPFSARWAFGVLVGINLIGEGVALLLYLRSRQAV